MADMTVTPVATHGFFLDGKWLEEGDIVDVRGPYDGALVAHVYRGRREHADSAIAAAVKAFGTTRRLPAFERQRVLRQIATGIHDRKEEFSRTIALEGGKPIKSARTEVDRAVFIFNIAAEETVRGYGEYLPLDWQQSTAGRWGIVKRFPLGPLAGITPFHFPLNLVAHKVAPAIAAGCSMVLKPAPQTPLTALLLAEVIQQAGWPDGGFNAVLLSNEDSGLLVSDDRIKLISFTGSAAVGWALTKKAGTEKVCSRTGREFGRHRPQRYRSRLRRRPLRYRRLCLRRTVLHFRAAHSGRALRLRKVHRAVAGGSQQTESRRSTRRVKRPRPAHPGKRRHPRRRLGAGSGTRWCAPALRR